MLGEVLAIRFVDQLTGKRLHGGPAALLGAASSRDVEAQVTEVSHLA